MPKYLQYISLLSNTEKYVTLNKNLRFLWKNIKLFHLIVGKILNWLHKDKNFICTKVFYHVSFCFYLPCLFFYCKVKHVRQHLSHLKGNSSFCFLNRSQLISYHVFFRLLITVAGRKLLDKRIICFDYKEKYQLK